MRAAAAAIASLAASRLSGDVFSAMLASPAPNWTFRRNLYFKFVRAALRQIKKWECVAMVRSDVQNYFPSISVERLLRFLSDLGCDREMLIFLVQTLMTWQDTNEDLQGLPIGLDASSLIGSMYMAPVDESMHRCAKWFYRYTDDMAFGLGDDRAVHVAYEVLDEALAECGLHRSIAKSNVAYGPQDAADLMQRRDLAYVEAYLQMMPGVRIEPIKEFFDAEVSAIRPVDLPALHKCLRAFASVKSSHAVQALLDSPELFDADPRAAANYLESFASTGEVAREAASRAIYRGVPAASRIHLLRVASKGCLPSALGNEILALAMAPLTSPERKWSLWAYGRSSAYKLVDLLEVGSAETDSQVRRAAILTLHGASQSGRRYVAQQLSAGSNELALSADWAMAA